MLIEKPIAFNLNFLKKLKKKNEKNCKNKFVGFNRRFYKTVERLHKRLSKNDLAYVDIRITEDYDEFIKKFGNNVKSKIHHITATSHIIDLALYFFGKLTIKNLKIIKSKTNNCKSYFINCLTKKKININISILNQNPTRSGITCYFNDQTTWDLSPLEILKVYKNYNIRFDYKKKINVYEPKLIRKYEEKNKNYKPGFFNQLDLISKKKVNHAATIKTNINFLDFFGKLDR